MYYEKNSFAKVAKNLTRYNTVLKIIFLAY